jgi:hypothetical protein
MAPSTRTFFSHWHMASIVIPTALLVACSGGGGGLLGPSDGGARATSDGGVCVAGNETCTCYPNGTCNGGLSCLSGLCVDAGAAGDASSGGSGDDAQGAAADGSSRGDATRAGDSTVDGASAPDAPAGDATQTGDSATTCAAGAPCTPAGVPDPCGLYAIDCSSAVALCVRVGNQLAGHSCGAGAVCQAQGTCTTCQDGTECVPASSPCYRGTLSCAAGTCTATATLRANGSSCGTDSVCNAGACATCAANAACTPSQGSCVQGRKDCSTGVEQCVAVGPLADGTPCATGICNAGACAACASGAPCTPTNSCHTGALGCGTTPSCVDTGSRGDNVYCGVGGLCTAGTCGPANAWLTRGEDNRTFTGGWVYSFANNGASVAPLSSSTVPFAPSPGGRSGSALAISGIEPVPSTDVSVQGTLGWTFTDLRVPFNLAAIGSGVDVWVKSAYAVTLEIAVLDVWTDPSFPNCSTSLSAAVVDRCYNWPTATCNISSPETWTECTLPWSFFVRQDWGNLGAGIGVDASQALGMQINVPPTSIDSLSAIPFDFAVDDVAFIP